MKPARFLLPHLSCLAVAFTFLSLITTPITQAGNELDAAEARTTTAEGPRLVEFADDLLTVDVRDVSLKELLQEVARQGGLTIMMDGSIDERMTVRFDKLPVDDGLRRILRDQNFVLKYAQRAIEESQWARPRIMEVRILARSDDTAPIQTSRVDDVQSRDPGPEVAPERSQPGAALGSEGRRARKKAAEALGESGGPEAIGPLRLALEDRDNGVREAAVSALARIGGEEAVESLDLAVQDQSYWVRKKAVRALGQIGGERAALLLAQALADEDELIRDEAAEALEELVTRGR
jgi:hypothetical protein